MANTQKALELINTFATDDVYIQHNTAIVDGISAKYVISEV